MLGTETLDLIQFDVGVFRPENPDQPGSRVPAPCDLTWYAARLGIDTPVIGA